MEQRMEHRLQPVPIPRLKPGLHRRVRLPDSVAPHETTTPPAATTDEQTPPAPWGVPLGARSLDGGRCEFRVWAPHEERVELHIIAPEDRRIALTKIEGGYHEALIDRCPE